MVYRSLRLGAAALAVIAGSLLTGDFSQRAQAIAPLAGEGWQEPPQQGLLHRADVFRNCQEIYWCGVRRDGSTRCGPTLRCETCTYVRTCRRATGCVWEEKCRWGPYIPPQQQ
jgi:hypothetical protein